MPAAGKRGEGVRVNVLYDGVGSIKTWAPLYAGLSHYESLLDAGVRIHERRDALLHAKTAVIDGVWSSVGSTNLDFRSFQLNAECNFLILDDDVGRTMSAAFERDLESSREIDASWHRSGAHRTGDYLARKMGILL